MRGGGGGASKKYEGEGGWGADMKFHVVSRLWLPISGGGVPRGGGGYSDIFIHT